ncbi:hypothetical protein O181_102976 [Austropuccinia psidii MF-1]|uniref:Uncharacterized protein n=1 Tax=Austropuccinia psidii MF-1 TaxID=1389203 RepID=A0A9Q3JJR3_9BASI|nr:hypothetical protein [Austropuccinia psidii MF-1]
MIKINTSYENTYIYLSFLVFEDNPTEDNKITVERLVEETCPSSPTPVIGKKRKERKLVFPRPNIQDSEEEDHNTPSNQMELDSELELIPQKGKEGEKFPVEQNPH